jgi:cytochrome c peroxidase
MRLAKIITCLIIVYILAAFVPKLETVFNVPVNWPQPHYSFERNPIDSSKIQLGRALFYSSLLSRNNKISCASCHSPYASFAHTDHALSHGIDDKIGTRNAPALVNLAWSTSFMWDGAINHLDMQALFPITHPLEMDETMQQVVEKLKVNKPFPKLFYTAYNDSTITGERVLKCISQFMLSLVSAESKYDSVMRHEAEFTIQEKNGYRLFKMHCSSCHSEPLFTNYSFQNNGLALDTLLKDAGRMKQTHNSNDSLKFKVPTLRNVEYTFPYMHDGRFRNLSQVLLHYSNGITNSSTVAIQLKNGVPLTSNERVDIAAFLLCLSDKKFIFNPSNSYPRELLNDK